jgi:hypothetical protein
MEEEWEVNKPCYQVQCAKSMIILGYKLLIHGGRETAVGNHIVPDPTAQA